MMTTLILSAVVAAWKGDDDFSWLHGANYNPSYAATDVEIWLNYDHDTIDRELGYAESIGLNGARVFLQSLVYHHQPEKFLKNLEDFVSCADSHGIKVMPILFDSCFGVSPSLESRHIWVANPGPDKMAPEFWPESERYARAVVSRFIGDPRIAMWDVMNEPTATPLNATPDGQKLINDFLAHHCKLIRSIDPTHPITVGVAGWNNTGIAELVDVLSCHSYAADRESFVRDLTRTRDQAKAAGKPWIISECCAPGWGNHYEMVLPELRRLGVGHFIWEVMIGNIQFRNISGLLYPDGTVRRISQIESVMNAPAPPGLIEKDDTAEDAAPFLREGPGLLDEYLAFLARNSVTEITWRERTTAVRALAQVLKVYGDRSDQVLAELDLAIKQHDEGEKEAAFKTATRLMAEAGEKLSQPRKAPALPPMKATIHRDTYGVPHIYAQTEEAAYYALGHVMCQDAASRVFANLRIGVSRAPEIEGEPALNWARLAIQLRCRETAEKAWAQASSRLKRMLTAFCKALNDYRAKHPDECANTLEATPIQALAWGKFILMMPSWAIAQIDADSTLAETQRPVWDTTHSSAFVIGPSRTASGAPIVLIDPHWPAQGSLSWYEVHLHAGRLDAGGFMVPGFPFIGLGYTPGAAWGMTAGGADAADVFELKLNPDNHDQYLWDGKWKDFDIVEGEIPVKDGDGLRMDHYRFRYSVHGPVCKEKDGRAFAAALARLDDPRFAEQLHQVQLAKTKDELLNAMRLDQLPWLNFCYGTAEGHFGYIQLGCCPVRPERPGLFRALDGTVSRTQWQGYVPLDELPQVHDPDTGFCQSCNTSADVTTTGLSMKPEDFAPGALFGHYGAKWRGRGDRCTRVLSQAKGFTLEDAERLALDTLAPAAAIWQKPLVQAFDRFGAEVKDPPDEFAKAAKAVRVWDGHVDRDSVGATVFRFWREEYVKLHPKAGGEGQGENFPKSDEELRDAAKALASAVRRLRELRGTALVPWGEMLRLRRGGVDLPLSGDGGANNSEVMRSTGSGVLNDEGRFIYNGGQVVTSVVQLTNPIEVRTTRPYGQSLKPGSPHYTDQMKLFSDDRMRPGWHDWSQLQGNIESSETVVYSPAK